MNAYNVQYIDAIKDALHDLSNVAMMVEGIKSTMCEDPDPNQTEEDLEMINQRLLRVVKHLSNAVQ
jgi:hypothetical protein